MTTTLCPTHPVVPAGVMICFNVLKRDGTTETRMFFTLKEWDYRTHMLQLHKDQVYKTEEVLEATVDSLIRNKVVIPITRYELELGTVGRVSEALMDVYKDVLNNDATTIKEMENKVKGHSFGFLVDDGCVTLLSADGDVLSDVKVTLAMDIHTSRTFSMELVGPLDTLLPHGFEKRCESAIASFLAKLYPNDYVSVRIECRQSDLASALESLE